MRAASPARAARFAPETLSTVAALLGAAGEPRLGPVVLRGLAVQLAGAVGAPVLSIRLLDRTGRTLDLKASVGLPRTIPASARRLAVDSPLGHEIVRRARTVRFDVPSEPRWVRTMLPGVRSGVFVPIRAGATVVGALGVGYRVTTRPAASQLRFLDALGRHLGVALQVVRARETRRKTRAETDMLRRITAALSANLEMRAILDMVTAAAAKVTHAAGAVVILQTRERGQLEVASQSQRTRHPPRIRFVGVRFPAAGSLAGYVVRTGRTVRLRDATVERRHMARVLRDGADARGILMVPLKTARTTIGVLAVSSRRPRVFSDHDRRILTQLGQQASIAIQNARLFDSLRSHRQLLRRLYSKQSTILEGERKRIAHELHDEMGPTLSAILISLQLLKDGGTDDGMAARVGETQRLLTGLIDKVRELSYGLHPPTLENLGLAESLAWLIESYFSGGRLTIDYRHAGSATDLDPEVALAIYRTGQEALTNVVKHARASRARVRLRLSETAVTLHVRDDGRGFDLGRASGRRGLGLASMRERTEHLRGRMMIRSAPGKGCRLTVSLPVEVRGARALG